MRNLLLICILFGLSLGNNLQAQDDDPWWKKLFKSDDTENTDQQQGDQPEEKESVLDNYKLGEEETADATLPRSLKREPGNINYKKDSRIDSLNQRMINDPAELRGFRVQIFFGSLDQAREARAEYIKLERDDDCYLEQSPPNFGVRVGDFRTKEEAYEVLVELKKIYPSAYIVPDKIELPKLPE
ncbi:SPOR domain-containing protein [Halocola ammonii]